MTEQSPVTSNRQIKPQNGIMDIALYQGGKSKIAGVAEPLKLSSNENPFGASPKAMQAFREASATLHRYPSADHAELRAAIAEVEGLNADQIICGAGSDEILAFLCQAFAGQGDEVIHTEHGFAIYKINALAAGATPVEVPENNRTTDVAALLKACTPRTKIVFIANPNNPTGTMIDMGELTRLVDGVPAQTLVVLDGAYAEFAEGYDGGLLLIETRPNVVMTRTFSKLHGLGGMRVGWGYGPQAIIDILNRIRGPFNLSHAALVTSEAAIKDRAFAETCLAENAKWRAWLAQALQDIGVPSDPSHGNFLLAQFKNEAEAAACDAHLQKQGIIIRRVGSYGLPHCLRITVGDEAGCKRVVMAIASFKEARA